MQRVAIVGVGAVGQACAFALPTVVGRQGATNALGPSMSDEERRAFERSAATLRDASRSVGVPSAVADRA